MSKFEINDIVILNNSKSQAQYRISNIFDNDVKIMNRNGDVTLYAIKGELIIESIPHGVIHVVNSTEITKAI